jgi:hypothetical protein
MNNSLMAFGILVAGTLLCTTVAYGQDSPSGSDSGTPLIWKARIATDVLLHSITVVNGSLIVAPGAVVGTMDRRDKDPRLMLSPQCGKTGKWQPITPPIPVKANDDYFLQAQGTTLWLDVNISKNTSSWLSTDSGATFAKITKVASPHDVYSNNTGFFLSQVAGKAASTADGKTITVIKLPAKSQLVGVGDGMLYTEDGKPGFFAVDIKTNKKRRMEGRLKWASGRWAIRRSESGDEAFEFSSDNAATFAPLQIRRGDTKVSMADVSMNFVVNGDTLWVAVKSGVFATTDGKTWRSTALPMGTRATPSLASCAGEVLMGAGGTVYELSK